MNAGELKTIPARHGRAQRLAKGQAIKVGDAEDSYNTGLKQFLDEKAYKPTFGSFKTKEQAAKTTKEKA